MNDNLEDSAIQPHLSKDNIEQIEEESRRLRVKLGNLKRERTRSLIINSDMIRGNIEKMYKDPWMLTKDDDLEECLEHTLHLVRNVSKVDLKTDPVKTINEYENSPPPHRLPPEFKFDDIALQRGKLFAIGGKQGVGKTKLALNWIFFNMTQTLKTLFISIEMSEIEVWISLYQIYLHKKQNRQLEFATIENWVRNKKEFIEHMEPFIKFVEHSKQFLIVKEKEDAKTSEIITYIDKFYDINKKYPDYVFIDYIQIISEEKDQSRLDNRQQMIYKAQSLRKKAKPTLCSIVVLSQLNDESEFRESKALKDEIAFGIVIEREKDDDGYAETGKIKIVKSRFSRSGYSAISFNNVSGYIN